MPASGANEAVMPSVIPRLARRGLQDAAPPGLGKFVSPLQSPGGSAHFGDLVIGGHSRVAVFHR